MIKSVTVTSYTGESLKMTLAQPEKSGIIIKEITGLGAAKADINSTELATGDGALFNSSRVTSRNITMTLQFMFKPNIEYVRHLVYSLFHIKQKITLHFVTDYRDIYIDGYVESNDMDIFSPEETCQISIICPNPFFYKPVQTTEEFYDIEPQFEFISDKYDGTFWCETSKLNPNHDIPRHQISLGENRTGAAHIINYHGEFESGIILTAVITGTVTGFEFWSVDNGGTIKINDNKLKVLTGSLLKAGDLITINTKPGEKSITLQRNGDFYNIINCINRDATWFKLDQGSNEFAYTAESGTESLKFYMEYTELFEGL